LSIFFLLFKIKIMAANLDLLDSTFRLKIGLLVANCKSRGIEMRPNDGLRNPFQQAKIWRQSRSIEEIEQQIQLLKTKNAPFLAHCLESVGPQHGDHVTNAMPGMSWHQFGEALDCVWIVSNKMEWSLTRQVNGLNGYMVYANEAKKLGLDAGLLWNSFQDAPHVQLRKASSPLKVFSYTEIDQAMQQRFGQ
jgi:peptidoglycan LD-endopeptidase CwlK